MRIWKYGLLSIVIITGCAKESTYISKEQINPAWPSPITLCPVLEYKVIVQDDKAYVALEYQDSLVKRLCDEEKLRYIKDLKALTCFYRPKDELCL